MAWPDNLVTRRHDCNRWQVGHHRVDSSTCEAADVTSIQANAGLDEDVARRALEAFKARKLCQE